MKAKTSLCIVILLSSFLFLIPVRPAKADVEKRVVLEFDDGMSNHYATVRPILNARNLTAVFNVNPYWIGASGWYMSWTQVQTLFNEGNEIASHGQKHKDLNHASEPVLREEIFDSMTWLMERGFDPVSFGVGAGGTGEDNATVHSYMRVAGYTCYGETNYFSPWKQLVESTLEPNGSRFHIRRYSDLRTLDKFKTTVDQASGNVVVLVGYHGIASGEAVTPTVFTQQMDYLVNNGFSVVHLRDLIFKTAADAKIDINLQKSQNPSIRTVLGDVAMSQLSYSEAEQALRFKIEGISNATNLQVRCATVPNTVKVDGVSVPFSFSSNITSFNITGLTKGLEKNVEVAWIVIPQYTLAVASSVGGMTNPASGMYVYVNGTSVNITAFPSVNYSFSQWTIDGSPVFQNPVTVLMDANHTVEAAFAAIPQYILTITSSVGGTTDPSAGTYSYLNGSSVIITAYPSVNYSFSHWTVDGSIVLQNPLVVLMNASHPVDAVFAALPKQILTVTSSVGGTTDPAVGMYDYVQVTNVTITAYPSQNYTFDHWNVDGGVVLQNSVTVTTDANHTVEAVFAAIPQYTLTIVSSNGGVTDPVVGVYSYLNGSSVLMTAYPSANYTFSHWTVDGNVVAQNPIQVLMDMNHVVNASFAAIPPPSLPAVPVLTLKSNSTVSDVTFVSGNQTLEFVVSGPSGTTGYTELSVSKSILDNMDSFRVYLDGNPLDYMTSFANETWTIRIEYNHSRHYVRMVFREAEARIDYRLPFTLVGAGICLLGVAAYSARRRKKP